MSAHANTQRASRPEQSCRLRDHCQRDGVGRKPEPSGPRGSRARPASCNAARPWAMWRA